MTLVMCTLELQVKLVSFVLSVLTVSDVGSDVQFEAFQGMLAASGCDR